jgi:hypothetical protein
MCLGRKNIMAVGVDGERDSSPHGRQEAERSNNNRK